MGLNTNAIGWEQECLAHAQSINGNFRSNLASAFRTDFISDNTSTPIDFQVGAGNVGIQGGGSGQIYLGAFAETISVTPKGALLANNNEVIRSMREPWAAYANCVPQVLCTANGNRQAFVGIASSSAQCYMGMVPDLSTTNFSIWTESAATITANLGTTAVTSQAKYSLTGSPRDTFAMIHDGITIRGYLRKYGQYLFTQICDCENVSGLVDAGAWPQLMVKSSVGSEFVIADKMVVFTTNAA